VKPAARAWVLCAALAAIGCGSEGPPDRVDAADLPLAPGLEILEDIEACTPGTSGETNGSCIHTLIVGAGPRIADAGSEALITFEAEELRDRGWRLMRTRKTALEGTDGECELLIGLDTPEGYLKIVGRKPDPLGAESPETTRIRSEILRLSASQPVIIVDFEPAADGCGPE
jgi:hypothetical protein